MLDDQNILNKIIGIHFLSFSLGLFS